MPGSRVAVVEAEVALPQELEALGVLPRFRHGDLVQAGLDLAALEGHETLRVQKVQEVLDKFSDADDPAQPDAKDEKADQMK